MIKKVCSLFVLLITVSSFTFAQSTAERVRDQLGATLKAKLNKVSPEAKCPCNNCEFTYTQGYKITKNTKAGDKLMLWGQAKTKYRSPFEGGDAVVEFYAECRKSGSEIIVTKLKWRKDSCMRYAVLYDAATEKTTTVE